MRRPAARRPGLSADLDPATTVQRVTRSDARVLCVRPHPCRGRARAGPQAHRQPGRLWLRLGWRPGGRLGAGRPRRGRAADRGAPPDDLRRAVGGRGGQRPGPRRATSTGPPPSAPGGSCDERAHVGWSITGMGAVTPLGSSVETFWDGLVAGRVGGPDHHLVRPFPGRPAPSPARCSTSTHRSCSTARRSGATTGPPRWRSWPRARRWTMPDCRHAWTGSDALHTGIIIGSGLGGTGTLIDQIMRQPTSGVPIGSARSSSPWPSPTSPRARRPSASAPWAPTSRPRAPVRAPATPSARRPR